MLIAGICFRFFARLGSSAWSLTQKVVLSLGAFVVLLIVPPVETKNIPIRGKTLIEKAWPVVFLVQKKSIIVHSIDTATTATNQVVRSTAI